jgi:hypothetical protein
MDTVVILVNQPGGSGTFYYLAALLNTTAGLTVTPAVLLGDRIKVNAVRLDGVPSSSICSIEPRVSLSRHHPRLRWRSASRSTGEFWWPSSQGWSSLGRPP